MHMGKDRLRTDRLFIRPVSIFDVPVLHKWWNDPRIMMHVGFPDGLQLKLNDVYNMIIKAQKRDHILATDRRFIIEKSINLEPIGEISYSSWEPEAKVVSVGIKICNLSAQRQGYAFEAMNCFIVFFQSHLLVNKIVLNTYSKNLPARRLYEKVGFIPVMTRKQFKFSKTYNSYQDVVFYEYTLPCHS